MEQSQRGPERWLRCMAKFKCKNMQKNEFFIQEKRNTESDLNQIISTIWNIRLKEKRRKTQIMHLS